MTGQEQDATERAIQSAFRCAETGSDFSFYLGEKNIFLAKPTPEECREYGLNAGEIYAVSETGVYELDRAAFEAEERRKDGQRDENTGGVHQARDYDHFMERAGYFDSVADAHAETSPERQAERAAAFEAFRAEHRAETAVLDDPSLDPPDIPRLIEEAFAASTTPQQFQEELGDRGISLRLFHVPSYVRPGEDTLYEDGQLIAVYDHEAYIDYPISPGVEKWASLAISFDPNRAAIHRAFEAENGAGVAFSTRLKQENIFLAVPTPEECFFWELKPGELVAVVKARGSDPMDRFVDVYPLREEFEAQEQALRGKWIEKNQAFHKPRDFDAFMEGAGRFKSMEEARETVSRLARAQARTEALNKASREKKRDGPKR